MTFYNYVCHYLLFLRNQFPLYCSLFMLRIDCSILLCACLRKVSVSGSVIHIIKSFVRKVRFSEFIVILPNVRHARKFIDVAFQFTLSLPFSPFCYVIINWHENDLRVTLMLLRPWTTKKKINSNFTLVRYYHQSFQVELKWQHVHKYVSRTITLENCSTVKVLWTFDF